MEIPEYERSWWDGIFASNPDAFGVPLEIVVNALRYLMPGDRILDWGAGYGRHARFLVRRGLSVDAVDNAPETIADLQMRARHSRNLLRPRLGDITTESPTNDYHCVVFTFVSHCLSETQCMRTLRDLQQHTLPEGLNIIAGWMREGELYDLAAGTAYYFLQHNELIRHYDGWETLSYTEEWRQTIRHRPDGSRMQNMAALLLARKPGVAAP